MPLPENTVRFLARLGYLARESRDGAYVIVDDPTATPEARQRRGARLAGATIDAKTKFPPAP